MRAISPCFRAARENAEMIAATKAAQATMKNSGEQ